MAVTEGKLSESDKKYFENIVENFKGREANPEDKSKEPNKEQNNDDKGLDD